MKLPAVPLNAGEGIQVNTNKPCSKTPKHDVMGFAFSNCF